MNSAEMKYNLPGEHNFDLTWRQRFPKLTNLLAIAWQPTVTKSWLYVYTCMLGVINWQPKIQ